MQTRSRSTLFLMEQLIVIAVFAFCAAVCVKTFVFSYMTTVESKDKNGAVIVAVSSAESYKAAGGDLVQTARILGGNSSYEANMIAVYYDERWRISEENEAVYVLRLTNRPAGENGISSVVTGDISVSKIPEEEIISFTVAARWNQDE